MGFRLYKTEIQIKRSELEILVWPKEFVRFYGKTGTNIFGQPNINVGVISIQLVFKTMRLDCPEPFSCNASAKFANQTLPGDK